MELTLETVKNQGDFIQFEALLSVFVQSSIYPYNSIRERVFTGNEFWH